MPKWAGGSVHKPELVKPNEYWKLQWHRVCRWHEKIEVIEKRHNAKKSINQYDMDDIYAFFQNCYHLRYWIENPNPKLKGSLKSFFKNHVEMQICRDICNGTKHLNLTHPSIDDNFNIYREYDHFTNKNENPIKFNIRADKYKFGLFELIHKLFNIWDTFLRNNLIKKKTKKYEFGKRKEKQYGHTEQHFYI